MTTATEAKMARRKREIEFEQIGGLSVFVMRVNGELWPYGVRAIVLQDDVVAGWELFDPTSGDPLNFYDGPSNGIFRTKAAAERLMIKHMA